jgi:hypothetical protein
LARFHSARPICACCRSRDRCEAPAFRQLTVKTEGLPFPSIFKFSDNSLPLPVGAEYIASLPQQVAHQLVIDSTKLDALITEAVKDRLTESTQLPSITIGNAQRLALQCKRRQQVDTDVIVRVTDNESRQGPERQLTRAVRKARTSHGTSTCSRLSTQIAVGSVCICRLGAARSTPYPTPMRATPTVALRHGRAP